MTLEGILIGVALLAAWWLYMRTMEWLFPWLRGIRGFPPPVKYPLGFNANPPNPPSPQKDGEPR